MDDRTLYWALCHTCKTRHFLRNADKPSESLAEAFSHFTENHRGHQVALLPDYNTLLADCPGLPAYMLAEPDGYWHWLRYRPNADVKQAFGTSTAMTCTLASLASSATVGRESTNVDNTANLFLDALVYLAIPLQTGTPANDKAIYVYAYGSEDGTNYTDNATGTDAALTLRAPTNLKLIGVIAAPDAGALTYKAHPMNIAPAFGGVMPRKWGIVVINFTGLALNATETNLIKTQSGVYATVI